MGNIVIELRLRVRCGTAQDRLFMENLVLPVAVEAAAADRTNALSVYMWCDTIEGSFCIWSSAATERARIICVVYME